MNDILSRGDFVLNRKYDGQKRSKQHCCCFLLMNKRDMAPLSIEMEGNHLFSFVPFTVPHNLIQLSDGQRHFYIPALLMRDNNSLTIHWLLRVQKLNLFNFMFLFHIHNIFKTINYMYIQLYLQSKIKRKIYDKWRNREKISKKGKKVQRNNKYHHQSPVNYYQLISSILAHDYQSCSSFLPATCTRVGFIMFSEWL